MIMVKSSHFGRAGLGEECIGSVQVKKKKKKNRQGFNPGICHILGKLLQFSRRIGYVLGVFTISIEVWQHTSYSTEQIDASNNG